MSGNNVGHGGKVGANWALSARQRLVLQCLVEEGGVSNSIALSIECAARIHDRPADRVSRRTRQRLFSDFTTPAVESLEREGLVEYDDHRGTVTLIHQPRR